MVKLPKMMAAALGCAAFSVLADVEVIDRPVGDFSASRQTLKQTRLSSPPIFTESTDQAIEEGSDTLSSRTQSVNTSELFYRIQTIQQEILELRGTVEQQNYEIKRLKQQTLDDYVSLDRRLNQLGESASPAQATSSGTHSVPRNADPLTLSGASTEQSEYRRAIDPIVGKVKDLDKAETLLLAYLRKYSSGNYTGNSKYWLGEVYLVKDKLNDSRKWFESLINNEPLHNKIPAAKLKLGIVYHKLNMNAQAKQILTEVSKTDGTASQRAAQYLKENF